MEKEKDFTLRLRRSQILLVGAVDLCGTNEFCPSRQVVALDRVAGRSVHYDQFVVLQKLQERCQFTHLHPVFIHRNDHRDPHLPQRYDPSHRFRSNYSPDFGSERVYGNSMSERKTILAELRENYCKGGLAEEDADPDPFLQFEKWLNEAVDAEVIEPNAMTLATADTDNQPSARTVLLKGLDESGFCFFTNYESRKARELKANPRASLVIHWRELERQVIVGGTVSRTSEHESRDYFRSRPYGAQIGAWVSENQTSPIPNRAYLQEREAEFQTRWPEGTEVPLPPFWGGYRVTPDSIEFWQGRPSRLHDRLSYTRKSGGWEMSRLSP